MELCWVFILCFRLHSDCAQEVRQQVAAMTGTEVTTNHDDVQVVHDTSCNVTSRGEMERRRRCNVLVIVVLM